MLRAVRTTLDKLIEFAKREYKNVKEYENAYQPGEGFKTFAVDCGGWDITSQVEVFFDLETGLVTVTVENEDETNHYEQTFALVPMTNDGLYFVCSRCGNTESVKTRKTLYSEEDGREMVYLSECTVCKFSEMHR